MKTKFTLSILTLAILSGVSWTGRSRLFADAKSNGAPAAVQASPVQVAPVQAAPPVHGTDEIRTLVQDVLKKEGFGPDDIRVAIVNEGSRVAVTIDISESISRYLANKIGQKFAENNPALQNLNLELNVIGHSNGKTQVPEQTVRLRDQTWKDALTHAREKQGTAGPDPTRLAQTYRIPHPQDIANYQLDPDERAHAVIYVHLEEIRKSGLMYNTITTDDYWREVFAQSHYPDLYDAGKEEIKKAVDAGLRPYHEGHELTAERFATLALKAISDFKPSHAAPLSTPSRLYAPLSN